MSNKSSVKESKPCDYCENAAAIRIHNATVILPLHGCSLNNIEANFCPMCGRALPDGEFTGGACNETL